MTCSAGVTCLDIQHAHRQRCLAVIPAVYGFLKRFSSPPSCSRGLVSTGRIGSGLDFVGRTRAGSGLGSAGRTGAGSGLGTDGVVGVGATVGGGLGAGAGVEAGLI